MSIVYSADLFCDARDNDGMLCGMWTHGTTQRHHPPTKTQARRAATNRNAGTYDYGWTNPHGLDLCPRHSDERKDRQ